MKRPMALFAPLLVVIAAMTSGGCSTVGYYAQAIGGHLALMRAREPIDELLADPELDATLRTQLETLTDAREFAVDALLLPQTDSYRSYAATGRQYVTWNVVAAEEFSVQPHTWCFPIAGCVNYRGYFAEADATAYAADFERQGYDVTLGGASAYSTLGWFDDPVLDTMLRGSDIRYVGTLFHEMAHQKLYVPDDSDFNEAYATFVEQDGVRRWLRSRNELDRIEAYEAFLARGAQFAGLLGDTRAELQRAYAAAESRDDALDERRATKQAIFARMRDRYEDLKRSWNGYRGYDGWFQRDLNNARLVSVATYRRNVPAFQALMREAGDDLQRFHQLAADIAALEPDARAERMAGLRGER